MVGSNYFVSWKGISVRIKSLLHASSILFNALKVNDNAEGSTCLLLKSFKEIYVEIESFKSNFEKQIPDTVLKAVNGFIKEHAVKFAYSDVNNQADGSILNALKPIIVILASLEAQISYLVHDRQTYILKSVEIAFAHLQRMLVVDYTYRELWIRKKVSKDTEKNQEEPDFEKLGGVHLLLHKIWAFKVDAKGGKTDLVLSTQISESDQLMKCAEGLILTEWKVYREGKKVSTLIDNAKKQANLYAAGPLYSLELANYCFLVIVSEKALPLSPNEQAFTENGIKYKVINIAYNPNSPSIMARSKIGTSLSP